MHLPKCFQFAICSFFRSELDCDAAELSLGDEVEFSTTKKNGKVNAERIIKIPSGSIQQEVRTLKTTLRYTFFYKKKVYKKMRLKWAKS